MSKAVNKVIKAPTKQARPTEDQQCDPLSARIPNQVLFFWPISGPHIFLQSAPFFQNSSLNQFFKPNSADEQTYSLISYH